MIIDIQQYSAFSFLSMVVLVLVSRLVTGKICFRLINRFFTVFYRLIMKDTVVFVRM